MKSQQFLQSFGDHHIGFDFLFTVQETLATELCHQFITSTSCTTPPTYHDLYNWLSLEKITNPNVIQTLFLVNGPLFTSFLLRAGIRCGNGELYFSAYEYVSLLTFVNNNTNYQLLSLFEQYTMSVAPDKIKEFILDNVSHQVKSGHKDSETCGEGYDYRMEEANKAFKDNLHTKEPSIEDWNLVCSNTNLLKCMKELQSKDYQIGTGSSGARAPDYATRIDFCRSKIREREHLKFDRKCNLSNIQGERLHPNTVTLIDKCLDLKKQYIDNVICNDNFVTAPNPKSDFTSLL